MLKLGVFTVMLPDLTPEEAARELKDAGYQGVEWRVINVPESKRTEQPSFWGNNLCTIEPTEEAAHRARAIADENGLEIPGLGTYIAVGDIAATENAMKMAQICGARQIRVGSGRWPDENNRSYGMCFDIARKYLNEVQALATQYNVKGIVEIHHGTITTSASLAHRLVDGYDPNFIGVLHDSGNMVHEGFENYLMGLQLLGPYLAHVHIKNGAYKVPENEGVWRSQWSPLENGVVDFDALFTALRDVSYEGWIGLEDFSGVRPSREALRFNINFLKDVIARTYNA